MITMSELFTKGVLDGEAIQQSIRPAMDKQTTKIRGMEYTEFQPEQGCMWQPFLEYYMSHGKIPDLGEMFRYRPYEETYTMQFNFFWHSLLTTLEESGDLVTYARLGSMEVCV